MKKLTPIQKQFILYSFFDNHDFVGWKGIADNLLDTGECIVAGDKCIWNGGIGNFIKTSDAPNAYNCLLYKFDLGNFLGSAWFKQIHTERIEAIKEEFEKVSKRYTEISQL